MKLRDFFMRNINAKFVEDQEKSEGKEKLGRASALRDERNLSITITVIMISWRKSRILQGKLTKEPIMSESASRLIIDISSWDEKDKECLVCVIMRERSDDVDFPEVIFVSSAISISSPVLRAASSSGYSW